MMSKPHAVAARGCARLELAPPRYRQLLTSIFSKLVVLILLPTCKVSHVLDGTRSLHIKLFYWQQQRLLQSSSSWWVLNYKQFRLGLQAVGICFPFIPMWYGQTAHTMPIVHITWTGIHCRSSFALATSLLLLQDLCVLSRHSTEPDPAL